MRPITVLSIRVSDAGGACRLTCQGRIEREKHTVTTVKQEIDMVKRAPTSNWPPTLSFRYRLGL